MPITQERMIALANAGADYKQAFEQTWESIHTHYTAVRQGTETAEQALQSLFLFNAPGQRVESMKSGEIIAVERSHFRSNRGRNAIAAKSARRRREGLIAELAQDLSYKQESEPRLTSAPRSIERKTIAEMSSEERMALHPQDRSIEHQIPDTTELDKELDAMGSLDGILGEVSEETKQEIEKFLLKQNEQAEWIAAPGYSTAPKLCQHKSVKNGICPSCGKEFPS